MVNIMKLGHPYNNVPCPIQFTPQITITSIKKMEEYYKSILSQGGEGIMIKHQNVAILRWKIFKFVEIQTVL